MTQQDFEYLQGNVLALTSIVEVLLEASHAPDVLREVISNVSIASMEKAREIDAPDATFEGMQKTFNRFS